jgi:hypothetical protein
MSDDMPKSSYHTVGKVSAAPGRFERFIRSVQARFRRLRERVGTLETTVEPLVDHVADLEAMVRDLAQRRRSRRRGRRAA